MIYKQHKMGAYNIHTIKTDRFKNIQIEVIFRNNVDKDRVSKRIVLFDVLMENNKNYKTKREMILKQEELYNALLFTITYKIGGQVLTSVGMDMLNPKYADYNYLDDAFSFLFKVIFEPNLNNNEFDENTMNTIKKRLIADIKTTKENPSKYSIQRALTNMDENSITSINMSGEIEDIEAISSDKLLEEYNNVLEHDYVDIFVIGDIDENEIIDTIANYANFKTIKNHELDLYIENKVSKKVKEVSENSSNAQSNICFILNTLGLTEHERKYEFQIYNMILGGGSLETKLYHKLRDENSLCYSLRSYYQKYDELLLIGTSVDKSNVELAKKLIKETLKDMKTKVTDEEVATAISSKISAINMSYDEPGRIIDEYLFRYMSDLDDVETRIEEYKKVTKEDVMEMANKLSLNTIYVLESGDDNGEN